MLTKETGPAEKGIDEAALRGTLLAFHKQLCLPGGETEHDEALTLAIKAVLRLTVDEPGTAA